MKTATTIKWVGLALLGILVAASVAVAASRLAGQQIGLASEPISAGRELAPKASSQPKPKDRGQRPPADDETTATGAPPPTTPTPPTGIDHSGGVDSDGDRDDD